MWEHGVIIVCKGVKSIDNLKKNITFKNCVVFFLQIVKHWFWKNKKKFEFFFEIFFTDMHVFYFFSSGGWMPIAGGVFSIGLLILNGVLMSIKNIEVWGLIFIRER